MTPPVGVVRSGVYGSIIGPIPHAKDLHSHYNLRESAGTTTIIDQTGNGHNLSGSYTGPTATINSIQAGEFDGVDDTVSVTFGSSLNQPTTIFIVYERTNTPFRGNNIYDGVDSTNRQTLFSDSSNDRYINAGSSVVGGSIDQNPHITTVLFNGINSNFRVDGVEVSSGNPGTQSLGGFTVGSRYDEDNHAPVSIGEILIYPMDKSEIYSNVESYLSDNWGGIL